MKSIYKRVATIRQDGEVLEVLCNTETGVISKRPLAIPTYQITEVNIILTVICEDEIVHTEASPFCMDISCPCHMDDDLLREYLAKPLTNGLLAEAEAQRLRAGQQITG